MAWFLRTQKNIENQKSKEMPNGLWTKCPSCKEVIYKDKLEEEMYTCFNCGHHFRIRTSDYIDIIFDKGSFVETHTEIKSADPLEFVDTKPYPQRIEEGDKKSGVNDSVTSGHGLVHGRKLSAAMMNFNYIGGSLGSVAGEKIYRAAKYSLENKVPLLILSASGGARMQEAAYSLMQMAKTSAILGELAENKIPYISLLTDPTTGGVSASYAMLGDVNIAEPGALIGFAGPRVIEQTIRKKLPQGFQRAEFLLEHGFLDMIVKRQNLKDKLAEIIKWYGF